MIFRYPGGKGKLQNKFLHLFPETIELYAEPFVGGGSVAISVARKHPQARLIINDINQNVSDFWKTVAQGSTEDFTSLVDRINITPTINLFKKIQQSGPVDAVESGFRALFLNRTTFSGILRSGPIGGYDSQETAEWKVDARWNIKRLQKELQDARSLLYGRTEVFCEDFRVFLPRINKGAFTYLDPPYRVKGDQLYGMTWTIKDHTELRDLLVKKENWILSYDNDSQIRTLYADFEIQELEHCRSIGICNGTGTRKINNSEIIVLSQRANAENDWRKYAQEEHWHEAARVFPFIEGEEFRELVTDIEKNGLRNPVALLNDQVLDGRNRVIACKELGITPTFYNWGEKHPNLSPVAWVVSQNIHRRNLNTSQRAVAALGIEKVLAKEAKDRQRMGRVNLPHPEDAGKARDHAGELMGVGGSLVQRAKLIETNRPELLDEIKAGKKTINGCIKEINRVPEENILDRLARKLYSTEVVIRRAYSEKQTEAAIQIKQFINTIEVFSQ